MSIFYCPFYDQDKQNFSSLIEFYYVLLNLEFTFRLFFVQLNYQIIYILKIDLNHKIFKC